MVLDDPNILHINNIIFLNIELLILCNLSSGYESTYIVNV